MSDPTPFAPRGPSPKAAGHVFGGYEVEAEVGRGGMGVVYRARQQKLNRTVALKMLTGHYGPDELTRFLAEAETAAGLHHTNIVHIYDVGENGGAPFYSMEFIETGSLADRLRKGILPVREAVQLLISIARALQFAHRNGVIHRDMKPANVLLDPEGVPKVTDFGIAKRLASDSALTLSGVIIGTPTYMAPEQAKGTSRNVGAAADIYALGAILYELLAGRPPFLAEESETTLTHRVITEVPVSPAFHIPSVPRDLERICLKCLQKEPGDRYSSAAALAEDLQRFLDDKPILARTQTRFKKARRKLVPLIAVITAIVLGFVLFQIFRPKFASSPSSAPTAASAPAPVQVISEKSIAVLPFENLSTDKENAFFTDGVQDEIRAGLAKVADLKVISRTSVMQYKDTASRNLSEIAQTLKVTYVLEGSVQRASSRVRVAVQLIDVRTDTHLWAEHYDRPLDDVFAIQSEIAKTIAEQLQAKISPSEKAAIALAPTSNLAAYDLYNRAKALIAVSAFGARIGESLTKAAQLLDQAVALDSRFVLAFCELSGAHGFLYFYGVDHTPARLALAESAVKTALRLAPDSGEAHLAQAQQLYRGYADYDGARAQLAIAQRTLPNDTRLFELEGYIDRRQGRHQAGLENLQRALELDPQNFGILQQLALSYEAFRRYPEMANALDRALAIIPNDGDTKVARAQIDLEWKADPTPLHSTIETLLAQNPSAAEGFADLWFYLALCERDQSAATRALAALGNHAYGSEVVRFTRKFGEGLAARARGDTAAAQAAFLADRLQQEEAVRSQSDYGPALCVLGLIDAGLGKKDDAIREGRRAVELLPISKDSVNGVRVLEVLAVIYAWTGEKDLACEQLEIITKLPASVSYGQLRLHPYWDALRGDVRFEKIVASLAPKDVK
ncbi:MAG: protein kinase [Verrucomicrobiota bacterium]|nr:protein kinase [Verrucomicrobiota bacterium]